MPRVACIKSKSEIYHLITRGINQQNIFSSFAEFINFHKQPNDDQCLDITTKRDTFSDKTIVQLVSQKYNAELASLFPIKPETQRKIFAISQGTGWLFFEIACQVNRIDGESDGESLKQRTIFCFSVNY